MDARVVIFNKMLMEQWSKVAMSVFLDGACAWWAAAADVLR